MYDKYAGGKIGAKKDCRVCIKGINRGGKSYLGKTKIIKRRLRTLRVTLASPGNYKLRAVGVEQHLKQKRRGSPGTPSLAVLAKGG